METCGWICSLWVHLIKAGGGFYLAKVLCVESGIKDLVKESCRVWIEPLILIIIICVLFFLFRFFIPKEWLFV